MYMCSVSSQQANDILEINAIEKRCDSIRNGLCLWGYYLRNEVLSVVKGIVFRGQLHYFWDAVVLSKITLTWFHNFTGLNGMSAKNRLQNTYMWSEIQLNWTKARQWKSTIVNTGRTRLIVSWRSCKSRTFLSLFLLQINRTFLAHFFAQYDFSDSEPTWKGCSSLNLTSPAILVRNQVEDIVNQFCKELGRVLWNSSVKN